MAKDIKVSVEGRISEYNLKLFSGRVARELIKKIGQENSRALLEIMKNTKVKEA